MKDYYFSITARVCSSIAQVHLSYFFLSYPRVLYHIGMEALDYNFNITYATLIFSPPQAENFRSSYLLNADFLSKKTIPCPKFTQFPLSETVFFF